MTDSTTIVLTEADPPTPIVLAEQSIARFADGQVVETTSPDVVQALEHVQIDPSGLVIPPPDLTSTNEILGEIKDQGAATRVVELADGLGTEVNPVHVAGITSGGGGPANGAVNATIVNTEPLPVSSDTISQAIADLGGLLASFLGETPLPDGEPYTLWRNVLNSFHLLQAISASATDSLRATQGIQTTVADLHDAVHTAVSDGGGSPVPLMRDDTGQQLIQAVNTLAQAGSSGGGSGAVSVTNGADLAAANATALAGLTTVVQNWPSDFPDAAAEASAAAALTKLQAVISTLGQPLQAGGTVHLDATTLTALQAVTSTISNWPTDFPDAAALNKLQSIHDELAGTLTVTGTVGLAAGTSVNVGTIAGPVTLASGTAVALAPGTTIHSVIDSGTVGLEAGTTVALASGTTVTVADGSTVKLQPGTTVALATGTTVAVTGTVALDAATINAIKSPALQAISASALPLPTGAATESTLALLAGTVSGGKVLVNTGSAAPVLTTGTLQNTGDTIQLPVTGFGDVYRIAPVRPAAIPTGNMLWVFETSTDGGLTYDITSTNPGDSPAGLLTGTYTGYDALQRLDPPNYTIAAINNGAWSGSGLIVTTQPGMTHARLRAKTGTLSAPITFKIAPSLDQRFSLAQAINVGAIASMPTTTVQFSSAQTVQLSSSYTLDTSTALTSAGLAFTSASKSMGTTYNELTVAVSADQSCDLYIEVSDNNSVWVTVAHAAVAADGGSGGSALATVLAAQSMNFYMRFRVVNGPTAQTRLRVLSRQASR